MCQHYDDRDTAKKFPLTTASEKYFLSPLYKSLSIRTQKGYRSWSQHIIAVFDEMHPDAILSTQVTQFMDVHGESRTAASHERSFISIVMNRGKARGYVSIANPCDSVKPIKGKIQAEQPRYYGDTNHVALLNYFGERRHVIHQAAFRDCESLRIQTARRITAL